MATPTLQIYSAIGYDATAGTGLSAAEFGLQLAQAEASGEKRVSVRINSGGGNWQEGQSMYDLLKASALKVDTYCVGLVASAATLPFMAGNKRLIAAHGRLMIHNCASQVAGGVDDLKNGISQQQAINSSMAQLYASASGQTVEKCAAMMAATTYLDAETAVALGFATAIMADTQAMQAPPAGLPTASLHAYYAALLPDVQAAAADVATAKEWLQEAIALHEKHMNGTAPTTGAAGEKSQMEMMDQMKKALAALKGKATTGGPAASKPIHMKALLLPIMAAAGIATLTTASSDADVATAVQAAFGEKDKAKKEAEDAKAALATATAALAAATEKCTAAEQKCADMEEQDTKAKAEAATASMTALVDGAISSGRIVASQKEVYMTLAKADLTSTKAVLDAIPARKSVVDVLSSSTADTAVMPLTAGGAMAEINARLAGR